MRKKVLAGLLLLMLLLVACGGTATPAAGPTDEPAPPAESTPAPAETPESEDEGLEPRGLEGTEMVTEQVLAYLAEQTGMDPSAFEVINVTEQEWSDSSLGCPQPGGNYLQVITPGYQVTAQAGEETFDVRTNATASSIVICEGTLPLSEPDEGGLSGVELPADLASVPDRLASEMGLDGSDLTLAALEPATWSDTSLGCPDIATTYLQVVTPGFRLQFETPDGETLEVHSNATGSSFVMCDPDTMQPLIVINE